MPYVSALMTDSGRKQFTDSTGYTSDAKRILELSLYEAKASGSAKINTNHILSSILREDCFASRLLNMLVPDTAKLRTELDLTGDDDPKLFVEAVPIDSDERPTEQNAETDHFEKVLDPYLPIRHGADSAGSANKRQTVDEDVISKYCLDLTELAREGRLDPLIGCENELSRLIQTLLRRGKNNPVLIGKPGVGKSAIVEGFAERIASSAASMTLVPLRAEISTTLQPSCAESADVFSLSPFFFTTSIMFTATTTGIPSSTSCVVR